MTERIPDFLKAAKATQAAAKAVEASGFVSCGAIIDAYIMVP